MSSDYLNCELSKELKELGVEFPGVTHYYNRRYGTFDFPRLKPDEGWMLEEQANTKHFSDVAVPAPSTAQVIDKLRELHPDSWSLMDEVENGQIPYYCIFYGSGLISDPCVTTAAGQALVKLLRDEVTKDGGV